MNIPERERLEPKKEVEKEPQEQTLESFEGLTEENELPGLNETMHSKSVFIETSIEDGPIDEKEKASMRANIKLLIAKVESILDLKDNEILEWAIRYHIYSKKRQDSFKRKIEEEALMEASRWVGEGKFLEKEFGSDFSSQIQKLDYREALEKLKGKFVEELKEKNKDKFILMANITVSRLDKSRTDNPRVKYCPNINFIGNEIWQKGSGGKEKSLDEHAKIIADILR